MVGRSVRGFRRISPPFPVFLRSLPNAYFHRVVIRASFCRTSARRCERFFRRLYSDPETYLQSVALPLFLLSALLESVQSVFWLYVLDIPEVFPEVEGSPYLEDAEFCVLLDIELLALELILLCALEEAFCEGELPPQFVSSDRRNK